MNKLALLLLPLLLAGSILRTSIAVKFIENRDAIAQTQCEQRENPTNCCFGSCVLSKSLIKVASADKPIIPNENRSPVEIIFAADQYVYSREEDTQFAGENKLLVWFKEFLSKMRFGLNYA